MPVQFRMSLDKLAQRALTQWLSTGPPLANCTQGLKLGLALSFWAGRRSKRRRTHRRLFGGAECPVSVLFLSPFGAFAGTLPVDQASSHLGEPGTVCGMVASANYAIKARGQPTFLNPDKPYPHQVFTVVIWGATG